MMYYIRTLTCSASSIAWGKLGERVKEHPNYKTTSRFVRYRIHDTGHKFLPDGTKLLHKKQEKHIFFSY